MEGRFFLISKYEWAGEVWIMEGLDMTKNDIPALLMIADCFARIGRCVKILTPVHFKSALYGFVYGDLIGTRYERKCPDLCIDGNFYEYESYVRPWTKRKLSNMLTSGLRQSDRLIIDNRYGASIRQILRSVHARLNVNARISELWIFDGTKITGIYP